VRGSTIDAAASPSSARFSECLPPPPGFENVRSGARRDLPNVNVRAPVRTTQTGDRLSHLGVLLPPAPAGVLFRSRLPAANIDNRDIETFTIGEWEARRSTVTAESWFMADNRGERGKYTQYTLIIHADSLQNSATMSSVWLVLLLSSVRDIVPPRRRTPQCRQL
jgi:hypothetical protein